VSESPNQLFKEFVTARIIERLAAAAAADERRESLVPPTTTPIPNSRSPFPTPSQRKKQRIAGEVGVDISGSVVKKTKTPGSFPFLTCRKIPLLRPALSRLPLP